MRYVQPATAAAEHWLRRRNINVWIDSLNVWSGPGVAYDSAGRQKLRLFTTGGESVTSKDYTGEAAEQSELRNLAAIAALYALLILVCPVAGGFNVAWDGIYGGTNLDEAFGIVADPTGGYLMTGFTSSAGAGGNDLLLLHIDDSGGESWSKTFGGAASDWGYDLLVTPDSDLVIVGFSSSFSTSPQVYVLKTDLLGNIEWSRVFGGPAGEYGYGVALAPDGGYVIAGETYSFGNGQSDAYVIKVDDAGVLQWSKFYGGAGYDWAQSICPLSGGGYMLAGSTSSFGAGNYDAYVLRLDANGDSVWANSYGSTTFDVARSVVQSDENKLVVAGVTNRSPIKGNDAFLFGIDLDGVLRWESVLGGNGSEGINRLTNLAAGSLFAVGESSTISAGAEDFFFLQLGDDGDSLESSTFGAGSTDEARTASSLQSAGLLVAGFSSSFGLQSQVYVTRVEFDYICGDADGDRTISVTDAVFLIQYIFADGPGPSPVLAGDADCNGSVEVTDVVYLIQYIFADGPAPCAACE